VTRGNGPSSERREREGVETRREKRTGTGLETDGKRRQASPLRERAFQTVGTLRGTVTELFPLVRTVLAGVRIATTTVPPL